MGMTVAFYSAKPRDFFELFAMRDVDRNLDAFFEKLETYRVADFPFYLHIPEDMDNLCQILRQRYSLIPPLFRELFVGQIWSDGLSESVWLLIESFASTLAVINDSEIEEIALGWAATFPYQEALENTPAYRAVIQLRLIAIDACTRKQSLLFYLDGDPAFFHW